MANFRRRRPRHHKPHQIVGPDRGCGCCNNYEKAKVIPPIRDRRKTQKDRSSGEMANAPA